MPKTYPIAVAGESFDNDDGSSRQKIIAGMATGEPLVLRREPENPYDSNAVAVLRESGEQIGYIKADDAVWVAEVMDSGRRVTARVKEVMCGRSTFLGRRQGPFGVVLDVTLFSRAESSV